MPTASMKAAERLIVAQGQSDNGTIDSVLAVESFVKLGKVL